MACAAARWLPKEDTTGAASHPASVGGTVALPELNAATRGPLSLRDQDWQALFRVFANINLKRWPELSGCCESDGVLTRSQSCAGNQQH